MLQPRNPTNCMKMDAIRFSSKCRPKPLWLNMTNLVKLIEQNFAEVSLLLNLKMMTLISTLKMVNSRTRQAAEDEPQGDESPIVKYINKLLIDAIRMGASDLHFEPYEKTYRVRYRVDGVLRQIATPPLQLANRLASRLKVMSQMDISEKRVPQDGRIKLNYLKINPSTSV